MHYMRNEEAKEMTIDENGVVTVVEPEIVDGDIVSTYLSESSQESLIAIEAFKDLVLDDEVSESAWLAKFAKSEMRNGRRVKRSYKKQMEHSMQALLNSTYSELSDGTLLSVADRLAIQTVAYTMKHPDPSNVLKLKQIAGEVDNGGSGTNVTVIGSLLATIEAPKNGR